MIGDDPRRGLGRLAARVGGGLGLIVGLQRRATGGILAPIITHLTWSVSMLYLLPLIFLGTAT